MSSTWSLRRTVAAMALGAFLGGPSARAQDPAPPPQPLPPGEAAPGEIAEDPNAQVLTQGPIHEAFAEPVLFEPKPGPVVAKEPPPPIQETPPDQQPEGDNVQWVPGYWAWDDTRNDYLWISGVWRSIPPGRQWVPGYWAQAEGGFQWVPGYWAAAEGEDQAVDYLPAPPASLEQGPVGDPPSPDATWAPGMWVWQDTQYAWRPGFWVNPQPGWMWTPAQYNWTPNGYVYNQGFWDYPLASRGQPFAPVYFSQPVYRQRGFTYSPAVGLLSSGLLSSLFVRPSYGSYYFGNYYGANNFQNGIYPFYSFHQSRYGYDPIYAYSAAQNARTNPQWSRQLHDSYVYRREHAEARPPATYAELRRVAARPAAGANVAASPLLLARPLNQIVATGATRDAGNPLRFRKIDQARRQELAQHTVAVNQFREERMRREVQAAKAAKVSNAARRVELPRSPLVARAAAAAPPSRPEHPRIDRNVARPAPNAAPIRHEPHPEAQPPAHQGRPAPPPGRREAPRAQPGAAPAAAPRPNPGAPPAANPARPPAANPGRPDGQKPGGRPGRKP